MLISSFLLGFLLEKFKFPTQTGASLFPGRSGFRAASSEVDLLGEFALSAKTHQEKKWVSPQPPPTPAPSSAHSILKKCAATSPPFPFVLKVTGIFPHEGIWQIQVLTSSAPTEAGVRPRAHRKAPRADMGLQQSSPLPSASSTTLISQNKSPQKTSVSPYSFSSNYWALLSLSGTQVSSQS